MRKTETKYGNLNHKDLASNRQIWRTAEPSLSDKMKPNEEITLIGSEKILTETQNTA